MTPRLVADIGNTRIKWGLERAGQLEAVALPPDDPERWREQLRLWSVDSPGECVLAATHPPRLERCAAFLHAEGFRVRVLDHAAHIPVTLEVEHPETVGIDRLLNAVAARHRVGPDRPIVIVNAGSAVTVDLCDPPRIFRGGAIFPGVQLQARALHDHTAKLPYVDPIGATIPALPGTHTRAAIEAGVFHAVCGGIDRLVECYRARRPDLAVVFGGGSENLLPGLRCQPRAAGPFLTLEGIWLTARSWA